MYCKNCCAEIPDGALFCGNCGMKIETETPETFGSTENTSYQPYTPEPEHIDAEVVDMTENNQNASGAYYNSIPENNPYNPQTTDEASLNTTLWIVLSIIEIVVCCGSIPGIIALIFAIIANNKKNQGNYAEAVSNLKISKIVFFVGIGIFFLGSIISIATGILNEITGMI